MNKINPIFPKKVIKMFVDEYRYMTAEQFYYSITHFGKDMSDKTSEAFKEISDDKESLFPVNLSKHSLRALYEEAYGQLFEDELWSKLEKKQGDRTITHNL